MYSTVQCSRCSHSIVCAIQVFTVPYLYCALYCTISNKITVMTFLIYFSWSRKENHFLSVYFIMSIFALENKILKFKSVVLSCARIQSDLKLNHASRAGHMSFIPRHLPRCHSTVRGVHLVELAGWMKAGQLIRLILTTWWCSDAGKKLGVPSSDTSHRTKIKMDNIKIFVYEVTSTLF